MKVLIVADCPNVFEIPNNKPDVVFLLGDIDYYPLRHIDNEFNCPKIGILGNHDGPDFFDGTNIINAHKKIIQFNGLKIAGFEGSPKYNNRNYLQYENEEVREFLEYLPSADVFLAHSNPAIQQLQVRPTISHQGFKAFTDYIESKNPRLFFHGHIHEQMLANYKQTKIYSVYPFLELEID